MDNSGNARKKLRHRLAAVLAAFSRRAAGRKRGDGADADAAEPLALPSYARLGGGKKPKEQLQQRPLVHITVDCAGRHSVDAAGPFLLAPAEAGAKKERGLPGTGRSYETDEWEGRKCPPSSPLRSDHKLLRRLSRKVGTSSSSSEDEEYYDDGSRNLFSSRSFSSDSSGFYRRERPAAVGRGAWQSCRYSFELPRASAGADAGFAVVKQSADPYEDFRKSMKEMMAEWPASGGGGGGGGGGGERSVERLLETYLVLNSPRHYPAILTAFADVRGALLP